MELEPITHLEKSIAGTVAPVTHLEKVIEQYGGGGGGGGAVSSVNGKTGAVVLTAADLDDSFKNALLDCFANVAWATEDGQQYHDALEAALYPPADLVSISAVFNQGQTVIYDTYSLDVLKPMLTVTAHYSDATSETVTAYTLSGTLEVGTSTITVSYGGKMTTFDVTVSAFAPIYTKTRSDCVIGGLNTHPSNADYIDTSVTKRCSCKSLDMYISGNHTYRIVATSDDPTVKMGIQLYNKTAVDAIETNQDFDTHDVQSFGWEESLDATKTTDATYRNAAIKLLRLTFKKANDSAFTSVPISKIEVYDITDVVTP